MTRLGGYELEHYLGGDDQALLWRARETEESAAASGGHPTLLILVPAAHLQQAQLQWSRLHPALLPFVSSGVEEFASEEDGGGGGRVAYLAARLPHGAAPLATPNRQDILVLLDALASLHEAGGVHGGLIPELLWRTEEGRPLLAGAGAPWPRMGRVVSPTQDIRDLGQVLTGLPVAPDVPADWLSALQQAAAGETAEQLAAEFRQVPSAKAVISAAPPPPSATVIAMPAESLPTSVLPPPQPAPQPQRLPRWPWLLLIVALGGILSGTAWATRFLQVPHAPAQQWPCCELQFVQPSAGAVAAAPVTLRVLDGPPLLTLAPELSRGVPLPATLPLPGPGEYRLRLSADGYAPQTFTVTAPSLQPIEVRLRE